MLILYGHITGPPRLGTLRAGFHDWVGQNSMADEKDDDVWARIRDEAHISESTKRIAKAAKHIKTLEPEKETSPRPPIEMAEAAGVALEPITTQETVVPGAKIMWRTAAEEPDGSAPINRRPKTKQAPTLLYGSIGLALIWVAGVGAYIFENMATLGASDATLLLSLAVLLFGPAFSLLAGLMGESIAKSNRESRQLMAAVRRLLLPSNLAEGAIRTTAHAIEGEINRLEGALDQVAGRLAQIEGQVERRTLALNEAGQSAQGSADNLARTMEQERQRLDNLLTALAEMATNAATTTKVATEGLDQHANRLTEVTQGLASQSTHASDLAIGAAERLDQAAQRAASAITELDHAAAKGESALARAHDLMVLARLRADEAVGSVDGAIQSLSGAAQTASDSAIHAANAIADKTQEARDMSLATLEEVRAAAEANARLAAESLRAEASAARLAGEETMAALRASGEAIRQAAEEARLRASEQETENRLRLDSARQTAFEVGKEADEFMTGRLKDAQIMIEQSAGLLDQTGARIQQRFSALAAACGDQARSVEDILDGLDRRLSNLPQEADTRARAIEAALNETLSRLNAAGRRAAEETAALDEAFQVRLRDSYSALGEVVQRLGGLSGVLAPIPAPPSVAQPAALVPPSPPPSPPPPPHEPIAAVTGEIALPESALFAPFISKEGMQGDDAGNASQQETPLGTPLKGRLTISSPIPVEDDPFADLQIDRAGANAGTQAGAQSGAWSWKQVLSSLDSKGPNPENQRIMALLNELDLERAIDDALLDRLRAMASRSRDQARRGTREAVTNSVKAMRLKLTMDADLRAIVVRFVEERREAATRGRLNGHEARIYLVADAAFEA